MGILGESPLELMLQVSRQAIAFRQRLGKLDEGLTRIVLGWLADDYLQARDPDTPASQRFRAALHLACQVRLMGERDSKPGTILLALHGFAEKLPPGPFAFLKELQKAARIVEGGERLGDGLPLAERDAPIRGNHLDVLVAFDTAVRLLDVLSPRERDVLAQVTDWTPAAEAAAAVTSSPVAGRMLLSRLRKKIRRHL